MLNRDIDMLKRKKYVIVGLGSRSDMYLNAIVKEFPDTCQLVGLCDSNEGRLQYRLDWAGKNNINIPGFNEQSFNRMIEETSPDCVIVTTRDCYHDDYICRAMEAGCDVITEKTDDHR